MAFQKGLHDIVLTKSWFIDQFCYCLLWQIRVIYSEVGLEIPSNPVKKTPSLDPIGDGPLDIRDHSQEEEDNFSDSDTEEEWNKEGMLSATPQTTYV